MADAPPSGIIALATLSHRSHRTPETPLHACDIAGAASHTIIGIIGGLMHRILNGSSAR